MIRLIFEGGETADLDEGRWSSSDPSTRRACEAMSESWRGRYGGDYYPDPDHAMASWVAEQFDALLDLSNHPPASDPGDPAGTIY